MLFWAAATYCTLKSMGAIQVDSNGNDVTPEQSKAGAGTMFYFLLAFYWGLNVLSNTLHVTTSGAFASWWFGSADSSNSKVFSSLLRACTSSFGSICFGSLLISIIQA